MQEDRARQYSWTIQKPFAGSRALAYGVIRLFSYRKDFGKSKHGFKHYNKDIYECVIYKRNARNYIVNIVSHIVLKMFLLLYLSEAVNCGSTLVFEL